MYFCCVHQHKFSKQKINKLHPSQAANSRPVKRFKTRAPSSKKNDDDLLLFPKSNKTRVESQVLVAVLMVCPYLIQIRFPCVIHASATSKAPMSLNLELCAGGGRRRGHCLGNDTLSRCAITARSLARSREWNDIVPTGDAGHHHLRVVRASARAYMNHRARQSADHQV